MDMNRVDTLLKYILLVAGQEDPGNRELGPIHLIKYLYLADLVHSQKYKGATYTNIPWVFHHFGPWSAEAYTRIETVVHEIGASERRISSPKYEDDFFRWELIDDELFEELDRQLPVVVSFAIKKLVHEFGDDTSALLHYVYTTGPILRAAPGEHLSFEPATEDQEGMREAQPSLKDRGLSKTAKSRLREKIEAMVSEKIAKKKTPTAYTPPRYDQVFFEGQEWLHEIAGEPIESQEGQVSFSKEIWKSPSRTEFDVS